MGRPKKPHKINIIWELVFEFPWEQEARLAELNSFSHGFFRQKKKRCGQQRFSNWLPGQDSNLQPSR